MIVRKVSEAVIRRLPKYYRQLIALQAAGVERISSGKLAQDRAYPAIVVGAGRIGTALANFDGFGRDNIQIQALFDIKPELVGQTIHGKPVLHMDALETYIRDNGSALASSPPGVAPPRTSQTGCRPPGSKGSGILRRWM